MKTTKYFITGLKLMLVLLLGSLITLIPRFLLLIFSLTMNTTLLLFLTLALAVVAIFIDGWIVIKYKKWIFK